MDRRRFVKSAGVLAALSSMNLPDLHGSDSAALKLIKIVRTQSDFEREKLIRPFGFKGGYLTELWQVASRMQSESGVSGIGIGTQSVLYGDADLFSRHSETVGNAMMYDLVNKSLEHVKKTPFKTPIELIDKILPFVVQDGKKITGKQDLNLNFVYNALVGVDNAAWITYAAENKFSSFETMIPEPYKKALSHRNEKIAIMYQIPYGMPMEDLKNAVKQGYFVFKIKTGAPGSQSEMLKADMSRLSLIHETLKNMRTGQTPDGKLIYTMDANARYEKKETLLRYLDHARKIGAFDQILLIEEPLNENNDESVADIDLRIGADESVHDEQSAIKRLDQGYKVMVLKGIAKTLSLSVKIAKLAADRNVPCMCADLTVNPILIDWNKNLAAHLAPFPVINMGMMETNGDMNYVNWKNMVNYHPAAHASWMIPKNGVFELNSDFYERSGGIFEPSVHYQSMF
ncbi:MAG: enolase C-terminal domain-like protein [Daejeonella sp.]|uniref:enolase C-terminal domain-like protein n=1 Tax=Daejeonella sp. TaxID=2805397 RepID=UPI0027369087|nr:enolase C-terminal domain-like protein [Daejeonella sp.]MDP3469917.1 enolase C-terminal domain-like protein [Daejeonella sp.]